MVKKVIRPLHHEADRDATADGHPDAVDKPRKPVTLANLKALTAEIPPQPESAADFVRSMRDLDRY